MRTVHLGRPAIVLSAVLLASCASVSPTNGPTASVASPSPAGSSSAVAVAVTHGYGPARAIAVAHTLWPPSPRHRLPRRRPGRPTRPTSSSRRPPRKLSIHDDLDLPCDLDRASRRGDPLHGLRCHRLPALQRGQQRRAVRRPGDADPVLRSSWSSRPSPATSDPFALKFTYDDGIEPRPVPGDPPQRLEPVRRVAIGDPAQRAGLLQLHLLARDQIGRATADG